MATPMLSDRAKKWKKKAQGLQNEWFERLEQLVQWICSHVYQSRAGLSSWWEDHKSWVVSHIGYLFNIWSIGKGGAWAAPTKSTSKKRKKNTDDPSKLTVKGCSCMWCTLLLRLAARSLLLEATRQFMFTPAGAAASSGIKQHICHCGHW